ncbi:MAG: class I adenylate-forming enzyme family protein [Acidobacteriota bacterium]
MRSPLNDIFTRVAADRPNHPAILGLSDGSVRTLSGVAEEARTVGAVLRHSALPGRACLLLHVGNHPAFVPLLLGCLETGTPAVLLDGVLTDVEVSALQQRLHAAGVVLRDDDPMFVGRTRIALPGGLVLVTWPDVDPLAWDPVVPAVVRLTSGSTALPKAILATEDNLIADGEHIAEAMAITPAEVSLGVVPITHAYGFGNIALQLILQGTTIVLRDTFTPRQLMSDLHTHAVSAFFGVPFMFDYVRRNEPDPQPLLRSRLIVTAGAPIDVATLRHFRGVWGRQIHSLYGTSETGGITFGASDELGDVPSVGRPLPGVTVTLAPFEGTEDGQGRVFVRGPNVMAGYLNLPGEPQSASLSAFVDGGYLTGDLARWNAGGELVLAGRISPFVNVAGRKVHPEEVQRVLLALPGVANASVFGMPDELRGERLVAWVQRAPGSALTMADIRGLCAERLAPYKIPRHFVFTDDAPVDARGKISRQALEGLVRDSLDRSFPV